MSREILLDVDGVVVRPRHKYFSDKFAEDYDIPIEEILPFFKRDYKKASVGEVDIKDMLPPHLEKWGWEGSVDDFLMYWFESEKDLDEKVLKVVKKLREQGDGIHLASDNEANRAKYLMEEVGLGKLFDSGFFSADLGVSKSDPTFFEEIAKELNVPLTGLHYWDDDPKNIEVAEKLGVKGHVYTTPEKFEEEVNDIV